MSDNNIPKVRSRLANKYGLPQQSTKSSQGAVQSEKQVQPVLPAAAIVTETATTTETAATGPLKIRSRLKDKYGLQGKKLYSGAPDGSAPLTVVSTAPPTATHFKTLLLAAAYPGGPKDLEELPGPEKDALIALVLEDKPLLQQELSVDQAAKTIQHNKITFAQYKQKLEQALNDVKLIGFIPDTLTIEEMYELAASVKLNLTSLNRKALALLKCVLSFKPGTALSELLLFIQHIVLEIDQLNPGDEVEKDSQSMETDFKEVLSSLENIAGIIHEYNSSEKKDDQFVSNLKEDLRLPLKLEKFLDAIVECKRSFKLHEPVLSVLQILISANDSNWLHQSRLMNLDAMYCLFGRLTHSHVNLAHDSTKALFLEFVPHAEFVCTSIDPEDPLMQQELGAVCMSLTYIDLLRNDFKEAEKHNRMAIRAFEKCSDDEVGEYRRVQAMYYLGNILLSTGDLDSALDLHIECLSRKKDIYQDELKSFGKDHVGSDMDAALSSLSSSYHQIGTIYGQKRAYRKALKYFTDAIKIKRSLDDPSSLALSLNCKGKCLVGSKDLPGGAACFEEELKLLRDTLAAGDPKISQCLQELMAVKRQLKAEATAMEANTSTSRRKK